MSDATRELLDKKANEFINARWVNKDGRTTGEDTVYGLSFNALHSHLVQFALENGVALVTPEKERGKP